MKQRRSFTRRQFKKELYEFWKKNGYNYELIGFTENDSHFDTSEKVTFKCNDCGKQYDIIARRLLQEEKRCKYCTSKERAIARTSTKDEILKRLIRVYGENSQYDLEKTVDTFTKMGNPLTVYCKIHGPYTLKRANGFINGVGCRKCWDEHVGDLRRRSKDDFIKQSINVWGPDRWGYDKVEYKNNNTKVTLYCKIHNEYFEQVPSSHLYGYCGCSKCKPFSLGEIRVKEYLDEHNITYIKNKTYETDTGEVARKEPRINVDFVVIQGNKTIWIEYNGQQHYEYSPMFHNYSYQNFVNQINRDRVQREMAARQSIELLVIPYPDLDRIPEILGTFLGPTHTDTTTNITPVLLPVPNITYYGQNKTIATQGSSIP